MTYVDLFTYIFFKKYRLPAQTCTSHQPVTDTATTQMTTTTTTAPTSATTTKPPIPITLPPPSPPPVQRVPCHSGSCWHVGGYRVYASCESGYCVCDSPDYTRESCLRKFKFSLF